MQRVGKGREKPRLRKTNLSGGSFDTVTTTKVITVKQSKKTTRGIFQAAGSKITISS